MIGPEHHGEAELGDAILAEGSDQSSPEESTIDRLERRYLGVTDEGEVYGSIAALARRLGCNHRVVKQFIAEQSIQPFPCDLHPPNSGVCYLESALAPLKVLVERDRALLSLLGRVHQITMADGQQVEVAPFTYWQKQFPGLEHEHLNLSGIQPVARHKIIGQDVRFWSRDSMTALANQLRRRNGSVKFIDPQHGVEFGSGCHFAALFNIHQEKVNRSLKLIAATRHRLPLAARGTEGLYSSIAAKAGLEHLQTLAEPVERVVPDPELRTVVGSIAAWSELLQVRPRTLAAKLLQQRVKPVRTCVAVRSTTYIFTWEQIQAVWPDACQSPSLLDELRAQAILLPPGPVHLEQSGVIEADGRLLAPRVALLEYIRRLVDPELQTTMTAQLARLERVTLQNLVWPGHWDGSALLWLYDLATLENSVSSEDGRSARETSPPTDAKIAGSKKAPDDASQLEQVRASLAAIEPTLSTSLPTTTSPRDAAARNKEMARLRNLRAREQQEAEQRIGENRQKLRDAVARARRRQHEHPDELRPALAALLADLEASPRSPDVLDVSFIDEEYTPTMDHEQFTTPYAWEERFRKTFPLVTAERLKQLLLAREIVSHHTRNKILVIAERDVLRFVLKICSERDARRSW